MAQVKPDKAEIAAQARKFGAEFVGFAGTARWPEFGEVPAAAYPQAIWPEAKTVIVLGLPLWLPIVEAAPTVLGREQAAITNNLLQEAAYRLVNFLRQAGYAAIPVHPGRNPARSSEPAAAAGFDHARAGVYAGLGTLGWSRLLLTREYGPRLHITAVLTGLELAGDPVLPADLCKRCLYCRELCPAHALSGDDGEAYAGLDEASCQQHEQRLQAAYCDPCGLCLKSCPVGEDRQLFQSADFDKYFAEQNVLAQDPAAKQYRDWVHLRSYGSYPLKET